MLREQILRRSMGAGSLSAGFFTVFVFFAALSLLGETAAELQAQTYGTASDSVAAPESYRAPAVNPAALSYGAGGGTGYARGFSEDGIEKPFDIFFNSRNLAYQINRNDGKTRHSFSISFPLFENFYAGTGISTITGSIGVLATIPNIQKFLEKEQIAWEVVKSNEHADFGAMYRPLNKEEQERMRTYIASSYDDFISIVAEGREMEKEEVHEVARGRVWTGSQAAERGLVDHVGGYRKALEVLREMADLPYDVELVDYSYAGTRGTFSIDTISAGIETGRLEELPFSGLAQDLPPELQTPAARLLFFKHEEPSRPLYLMPHYVPGCTD